MLAPDEGGGRVQARLPATKEIRRLVVPRFPDTLYHSSRF